MSNTNTVSATLSEEIKSAIASSGEAIKNIVKDKFVKEEVNRRADLLAQLFTSLTAFRKEGFKIKADQKAFNADGSVASETWSQGQIDKRKKFDEKLAKAEQAFEKALTSNEYDKIQDVIASLKPENKDPKGDKSEKPE